MSDFNKPFIIKGRGSAHNPANRFEKIDYVPDDDVAGEEQRPPTRFFQDTSKSLISYNQSPDVGVDAFINPYRGCEHGCAYCYARPYHEYLGLSAGLDFETQIFIKEDAPKLLRRELSHPKYKPQPIGLSGITDPYQPAEKHFRLTRGCLEVLAEFRNPVGIITKNHLVTRDIDLLQELARHDAVAVAVSVTTLDNDLSRKLEPRTSSPQRRLEAIRKLGDAGIPTRVMVAPVVPGLTDHEMPAILKAVAGAGASHATYIMMRLPHGVKELMESWLERHFPDRKEKVLNRVRDLREGELYKSDYFKRMKGTGVFAEQVAQMFKATCDKVGLNREKVKLSTAHFRRPQGEQMRLF